MQGCKPTRLETEPLTLIPHVHPPPERPIPTFIKQSTIDAPARVVFAWHRHPDALTRLIPPWEKVTVEQAAPTLADGERAVIVMKAGPLRLRWVAVHSGFVDRGDQGGEFVDRQERGPFARWAHTHTVRAVDEHRCELIDRVEYALPLGWLGELAAGWHVRRKLKRMFDYRHRMTAEAAAEQIRRH